jgi:hypothetical protein
MVKNLAGNHKMKAPGKSKSNTRKAKKKNNSHLSTEMVAVFAKMLGISARKIRQFTSIPQDQMPTPSTVAGQGSWAGETLVRSACFFEGLGKASTDEKAKKCWRKHENEIDEALGIMLRTTAAARFRAERSQSTELLIWAIGDTLSGIKRLPALLGQFERIADASEFDSEEPDTFPWQLVEGLVDVLKYFVDQCERHPERFRMLARELPYWPFLVTPHRAGYRKRFDRIAGPGFLALGTECPLDTSPRAMYRLQTPVCGLLWEEIFQDWINVSSEVRALRRAARERHQPVDVRTEQDAIQSAVGRCSTIVKERDIFHAAFALPDLSKATARDWADKFVIPYLHFKLPNWQDVPALAKFIGKQGGDTQAEKEIRRAVEAMARA